MLNRIWKRLRRIGARYILHGRLLSMWLKRQTRRFSSEYSSYILSNPSVQPEQPLAIVKAPQRKLQRLLFLCDNMWERRELLPELQKLCEVVFVDVHPKVQSSSPYCNSAIDLHSLVPILESIEKCDAGIIYLNGGLLSEELIAKVREIVSGPLLGMNLDDKSSYTTYRSFPSHQRGQDYRRWARKFDCNLTNSRSHVDIYRLDGIPCLYLPTGYHQSPVMQKFRPPERFDQVLSFVGSRKPEREQVIDDLCSRGIPVTIFGNGWNGSSFSENGAHIFRHSQINLGIGYNVPGKQITNLKNRDFECPGSGGCYLTTYDWELADLFDIGKEILCYRDIDDFVEIFSFYRRRPDLCLKIAKAGFERCTNEHTWAHRFAKVFNEYGFPGHATFDL